MGRILAIDYGTKRVGLAVTDSLQIIATALDTVSAQDIISYLLNYIKTESLECFVVGMPKNLDGEDTGNTEPVQKFIKLLEKNFTDIPIHLEDERFTSKIALQSMIGNSKKKDRRNKGNIDKISAVLILQSYLERKS